jgi:O-acetyl-ADP-ribose deacetylase (regulator of RNase III)
MSSLRVDALWGACYNRLMNQVLIESAISTGCRFQIVQGDITREEVDVIVNAANTHLQHGGGVAGVISRVGGPEIQRESDQWLQKHGPISHDFPAYTTGGRLPCKYAIHAVGPIWGSGDEENKLTAAVTGSLRLTDELKLNSIALPAISTGIYGFPKDRAARVIFEAIKTYFTKNPQSGLELVRLTLFDKSTVEVFLKVWHEKT